MHKKGNLNPKCLNGEIAYAVNNRGHLLPCCRCDNPNTLKDPFFQKLLKVSKISEVSNIDQILNSKEWKKFETRLRKNIGPEVCHRTCGRFKSQVERLKIVNPVDNSIIHQHKT